MSDTRWHSFQNRLVQEAKDTLYNNRNDGVAIISAHVLVDGEGTPLFWVVHNGKRIEPSKDARLAISQLLSVIASQGVGDEESIYGNH